MHPTHNIDRVINLSYDFPYEIGYPEMRVYIGGASGVAGGFVRDAFGNFVFEFSSAVRVGSLVEVKINAIQSGLQISVGKGYKKIILELD